METRPSSPLIGCCRSGGIVAATWASLVHHGWDGYADMTAQVVRAADTVRSVLELQTIHRRSSIITE